MRVRERAEDAEKTVRQREDELGAMRREERLEVATLKLALEQSHKQCQELRAEAASRIVSLGSTRLGGIKEEPELPRKIEPPEEDDNETQDLLRKQNRALKEEVHSLRAQMESSLENSSKEKKQTSFTTPHLLSSSSCEHPSQSDSDRLVDSWFQNDAVTLTLENDKLRVELRSVTQRFERSLQVIGKLQEEIEKTKT